MTESSTRTVEGVVKNYLCCSCGACLVVCPENAIAFEETSGGYCFPVINDELCTECGKCLRSCAGVTLSTGLPDDPFTGEALSCWIGKATDDAVYKGSQSGGGVTAILLALMAEGKIEGAVTVTMEAGTPPRSVVRIARTREEVLAAQGSKYCPTPVLTSLKDLTVESGPIAFVGLACHVHGLHNLFEEFPELRGKVGPVIGLVCDRVLACAAIDYLLWRAGAGAVDKISFEYRSKEWRGYPGDVKIAREGNEVIFLPNRERMRIKDYFTPARCRLCFDKMNVLSDVTVCDPWGIPGTNKKRGESAFTVRTSDGLETVRLATETGHLDLRETTYEVITEGQSIEQKKRNFSGYCSAWISMSRPLPDQAKSALEAAEAPESTSVYEKHLRHALNLDQFPSRRAMLRDARKWVAKQRMSKKIKKLFRP